MKIKTKDLLEDLTKSTNSFMQTVESFKTLSEVKLNQKEDVSSWSILECIEHLNLYGRFYLPEIEGKLKESKTTSSDFFKSGLLGNYFAKSMLPKEKLNKMKTFTSMNPINSDLKVDVLDEFLAQQNKMLKLLELAENKNLNKIKTSISISKLIKLKLGDTFRVVIYHNQRHILQAKKII